MELNTLVKFAEDIWTSDGPAVSFFSMPYSVRMTVIRLENGKLFVHSPIAPVPELMQQVDQLGEVEYIVSPNKIHHLYMGDWHKLYPSAKVYSSPGLKKRRPDIPFTGELQDHAEPGWEGEIDQLVFAGSRAMREVVFFHRKSKTLILADLIENFDQDWFSGWRKIGARVAGILAPDGRAPIDYRLSFFGRKSVAAKSLERIRHWQPDNIIIAHGACYRGNGMAELDRAFRWLNTAGN